jgi:hypothetical protein
MYCVHVNGPVGGLTPPPPPVPPAVAAVPPLATPPEAPAMAWPLPAVAVEVPAVLDVPPVPLATLPPLAVPALAVPAVPDVAPAVDGDAVAGAGSPEEQPPAAANTSAIAQPKERERVIARCSVLSPVDPSWVIRGARPKTPYWSCCSTDAHRVPSNWVWFRWVT